ncbi:SRPBCC family protein [Mucilaginibacter aquariorum]|uniref:SRPBCC domain-containing protein n=1 Tax=Mucilaginibacter aquariorum TaxID=2967225 RepID=A0ABT1T1Q5_9SPHI|nr:SRPBCC domain-containing protein [Mucilaginibacter aquariorum]MCQ6958504.1 SRPBCC domain-containing protein [Mucilaginibacter aquariorum]
MNTSLIERSIEINASPDKVWRVFTDAAITRQMGGEYVSDWEVGSVFGWKGVDGRQYTHGEIMEVETSKRLKHKLFNGPDKSSVASEITYKFEGSGDTTVLFARERLFQSISEEDYKEAVQGWDTALYMVKQLAEGI